MSTGTNTVHKYSDETRFALMEQSMQHMNQKLDDSMQHMNQKLDDSMQQMNQTINNMDKKLDSALLQINQTFQRFEMRFDKVDNDIKDVRKDVRGEIKHNFFWTLGIIGSLFIVVSRGFHWF